jgi:outer membrane protein TolC
MRVRALLLAAVGAVVPALGAQQPLTLRQVIELAEQKGLQARQAVSSRETARWNDKAFRSLLLPQIFLTGSLPAYSRSITPVVQPDGSTLYTPLTQTDANAGISISQQLPLTGGTLTIGSSLDNLQVNGAFQSRTWSSRPMSISLQQDIFRPNNLRWASKVQSLTEEVAERQYLEAREDVAISATGAFFQLYAARMTLKSATANAAIDDTLYTLNKGRFEVGKIGENDLLQSELQLLNARAARDAAQLNFDRALATLRLAVNYPPDAPIDVIVTNDVPSFDADTVVAVTQALRNQSQNTNLDLQKVQADRAVSAAKLNNGIGGTVRASYGYNASAPTSDQVYQNLLSTQGFSFSLSMPIFQWGERNELVQAAQYDRDRVIASAQSQRDQIALNAHFAALQIRLARTQLTIAAKADTVGQKRFDVAYNRYTVSKITITDLFQAQADKDGALLQYVQALGNYWGAYYSLRRMTLYDFEKAEPLR